MRRRSMRFGAALAFMTAGVMAAGVAVVLALDVPGKGSERTAILDALREPVSQALGSEIEFVVDKIVVSGDWAFVIATPQVPGGRAIDWESTQACSGDVSHLAGGLMMRNAQGWDLIAHALCPTDVAWATWPDEYGAPAELFDP